MKIFGRIFQYAYKYKTRLIFEILLSFLVSVFNGASLTSLIPIFDSLGAGENTKFQIALTKRDKLLLQKSEHKEKLSRIDRLEFEIADLKETMNKKFEKMTPDEIVFFFCSLVFPIYILKLICLSGTVYFITSTGFLAIRDLRAELYEKIFALPMNLFIREKTGILMSRIINDVDVLGKVISTDLKDAINDFFYIITHLLILFFLSWKMFLIVFIVIPLIMGPITAFSDKIRRATKNQQERLSALYGHLQEVIAGIRVIRAFSMEKGEAGRFLKINGELSDKTFKGHFYHQVGPALIELSGSIVSAIFLAFGAYIISEENFSKGMFMAFFLTLIFLMRPMKQMSVMFNLIQSARSAGERVFELLDSKIEIQNISKPKIFTGLRKEIRLENVSYQYPESENHALSEINLTIKKGETIALVGSSGSGKSTLTDLIVRLIDPISGKLSFDGVDLREIELGSIREKIGIVSQQVFLFNGTIRENIICGRVNASEKEIRKAAEDAFATEFIENLDQGFDTFIGERGVMLSGGQRQRISIARAFLKNPEILILDEATSALDTESERLVQIALETLYKNRTTILIAHRLSTVQIAEKIFCMENGRIIESGNHQELIDLNGKYKKLYDLNFAEV